jgi:hypothetical protein
MRKGEIMPKYEITISRTAVRTVTVEVEAENELVAEKDALNMSYDIEFPSEKNADYEVVGCREKD